MRRGLRLLLLALLLCGSGAATNYTYGAWSFTLPDGAEVSTADGVRGYQVDGGLYIFTPPEPLAGRSLEAVAGATIADLTRGQTNTVKLVSRGTLEGATVLAYNGAVTDPRTGTGLVHVYFFFEREGQWGLALLMANGESDVGELVEPLATVRFQPGSLSAPQEGSENVAPSLPALAWSAGRPDRTATSAAAITYPAARGRGLDPRTDLLPDTFDCYFADERTMTPTPDLRVQVSAGGTYAVNDGVTRTPGRWTQPRKAGETPRLSLEGPLSVRDAYVDGDNDHGQSFGATHTASGRKVLCYQAGPRAEALRLELTRGRIGTETMSCQEARGGSPFPLSFGTGTYTTPRGNGRARLAFSGNTGETEFSDGPFDLHTGTMSEDGDGNRELRVTQTITENRAFYSGSTTTLLALCRAKVSPKPRLLYGRTPAPATGVSGGPDGLFVSLQNRPRMVGNLLMPWYELELSLFRSGGYHLAGLDPTELGLIPDCGRTKPNGDPFCDRYTLKGNQLSFRDDDGTWEEAEPYRKTEDGFLLGETRYVRVTPLTAAGLAGVYSTDDFSGNGPAGGTLGGGVGVYNSLSSGYRFTPDGQFQWKYSSSSSTLISPNPILGGVVGGGGSTRTDGGQGKYTLKDNWLTLTFSDGRVQRLYVYGQPAFFLKEDPSRGQQLNVGGSWLKRVGQP